jgi:NAD(P)-dependent dehydrogenase (short-subunit alcohol dehydrogenase family)
MKNDKLNGKVAVVTGASKGIGADIAKQFAAEGAAVVVNYASDKQGADRVIDEITKRGGKAVAVQADVAKRSEVERLFAAAEKAFGKTDVLVNNAGVYEFMPLEEVSEQQFHRMFDTNVLGMLLVTQEALKHFNPDGGEHHQHRLARQRADSTDRSSLQRNKGCRRRNHTDVGEGTRSAPNSRERNQARHGDYGGGDYCRNS